MLPVQFLQKKNARHKFLIQFTIISLSPIPSTKSLLYISYSRGKKWNNETMRVLAKQGVAEFNQDFEISKLSLFRSKTGSSYKKKYLVFKVFESNREKPIGKCKINLGEICELKEDSFEIEKEISILLWKRNEAFLRVKFIIEPKMRRHPGGGYIDDTLTDQTTMTDVSQDEDDSLDSGDNDSSENVVKPVITTPILKPHISSPLTLQENGTHDTSSSFSLDGDISISTRRGRSRGGSVIVHKKSPDNGEHTDAIDRNALKMKRMMQSGKERRKDNQSISMDGDERSFLDSIGDELLSSRVLKKISSKENKNNSKQGLGKGVISDSTSTKTSWDSSTLRNIYNQLESEEICRRHNLLINIMIRNVKREFPRGVNISAAILLRVLYKWDVFSIGSDGLLNGIITAIEEIVSKSVEVDIMAYWFSACITMLCILQKDNQHSTANREMDAFFNTKEILLDENMDFYAVKNTISKSIFNDIEEDYFSYDNPSKLFQKDLKILAACIYCHLLSKIKSSLKDHIRIALFESSALGHSGRYTISDSSWILNQTIKTFEKNNIFPELIETFFEQIYYWIDAYGFNTLLDANQRLVCMSHGLALKMNLTQLENWSRDSEYCTKAFHRVAKLRQASDIVIMQKSNFASESTRKEVCPNLNVKQIRHLLSIYHADMFDQTSVPDAVIRSIPRPTTDEQLLIEEESVFIPLFINFEIRINDSVWQSIQAPSQLYSEEGFQFLKTDQ